MAFLFLGACPCYHQAPPLKIRFARAGGSACTPLCLLLAAVLAVVASGGRLLAQTAAAKVPYGVPLPHLSQLSNFKPGLCI